MHKCLGVTCAFAALLVGAPAALGATQTAHAGIVTASFSFSGKFPNFSHQRLKIERSGKVVYDQKVVDPATCGSLCAPASKTSVQVLALEGGSEPNVVLDLYSGGANCCFVDQVFSFDPGTMTYSKATQNFGDYGASIKRLGGQERFVGRNYGFKYAFTDGAASGEPIQVSEFSSGKFTDVTRSYPKLVAADAPKWLKSFKQDRSNGVGVLAAWAADEELLGHSSQVSSYLHQQLQAGHLKSSFGPKFSGQNFITRLQKLLKRLGYLSP
jgi:hypothetical protein